LVGVLVAVVADEAEAAWEPALTGSAPAPFQLMDEDRLGAGLDLRRAGAQQDRGHERAAATTIALFDGARPPHPTRAGTDERS
jgi:hypothetical protein